MANCLIICEGVTDRTLIGEYLKGISGWVYTTIGNNLFNDYDINWFKRGEEKLGIGIVNGDDFLPFAGDFAFRHRNSPQDIERLIIVTDNDDYEELESVVETAMVNLGFMRTDAQDILDGNFNRVLRFTISKKKWRNS